MNHTTVHESHYSYSRIRNLHSNHGLIGNHMSPLRDGANGGRMDRQIFCAKKKHIKISIFFTLILRDSCWKYLRSSKMFIWIFTVTDRVKFLEYSVFLTDAVFASLQMIFVLTLAARVTMHVPRHSLIFRTKTIWSLGHLQSLQERLYSQLALDLRGGRGATHQSQAKFDFADSKLGNRIVCCIMRQVDWIKYVISRYSMLTP